MYQIALLVMESWLMAPPDLRAGANQSITSRANTSAAVCAERCLEDQMLSRYVLIIHKPPGFRSDREEDTDDSEFKEVKFQPLS